MRDLGGGTVSGLLTARASAAPNQEAIVFGDSVMTYGELNDAATRCASALLALGLTPGDSVGLLVSNRPEYIVAHFALSRAGLRSVPINTAYKGAFLAFSLDHSDAKALITEARLADPVADLENLPAAVRSVVYIDGIPDRLPSGIQSVDWSATIESADLTRPLPDVQPSDIAVIAYTSGTTGRSKGVLSPALQQVVMAREVAVAMGTTTRDRLYTVLPLFHGAAAVASCVHAIYAGATICLSPRFSASKFWDDIRQTGATQFNALGSIIPMLLAQPESPHDRDHSVELVFAAPAPPEVLYRFEARFGVRIIEGYGATEIKNVMYSPVEGRKVGSMGKPTASSLIEIHDEKGQSAGAGVVGEIVYRPKQPNIMFTGYHRDPQATLNTLGDLWFHTGDLGYVDDEGFFYFVDRKKDALRRKGENISSQEVEAVLMLFAGIHDAAAIAVHSDLGEDEVLAVVQVEDPEALDFEALFRHCDQVMPHFMVPRYFRASETLPRTPTGKVQKVTLRAEGVTEDSWDSLSAGLKPTRHL